MIIVDVFVPGAAKTKGSMEIINKATGAMKESVVGSSRWRALMAQTVRDDIERRRGDGVSRPWHTACGVTVVAYLSPPSGWLETLWSMFAIWNQAGDLDKIVRNVLDALGSKAKNAKYNGGAIVDDNLVCRLAAEKRVAGPSGALAAGVRIIVETL